MKLQGYAAVFNSLSADLGGFREKIAPGAFRRSLSNGSPVFAIHHHNYADLLGSTRSGSLKLQEDARGLLFELELPDTALGRDVHELVRRGDLSSMSFSFGVKRSAGEKWRETADGKIERTLLDVALYEISTVARPAYTSTSVQARAIPTKGPTPKVQTLYPTDSHQMTRNRMTRRLMTARLTAA